MLRFSRFIHTPRGTTAVPIPKIVNSIQDIEKIIDFTPAPSSRVKRRSDLIKSIDDIKNDNLKAPKGVWYFVQRTTSGNIPVYTDYNNAGGVWTEVRKISGNVGALKNDIKKHLCIANKRDIWIKDTSSRIIIKGNHSKQVKSYLADKF